ncbi:MAG: tetratricopeptide repeat protein [Isosphaeraceae bacterium]
MLSKTIQRLIILLVVVLVASVLIFQAQRAQLRRLDSSLQARATKETDVGELEQAAEHLEAHLRIVPDDEEAMTRLAEILLKDKKNHARQLDGIALYERILTSHPDRDDIRRLLAEELIARGMYDRKENAPRELLETLLHQQPDDGHLIFLLGKCQEHDGDYSRALDSYQKAISYQASERLQAHLLAADLLRKQFKRPDQADQMIDSMVSAAADDYQSFLLRGEYRLQIAKSEQSPARKEENLKAARQDFERALKLQPTDPSIYTQLVELNLTADKTADARRVLEAGLQAVPRESSVQLHLGLALLEAQSGSIDKAIESLHRSLQLLPDEAILHWQLAEFLADTGAAAEMLVEVEQLKRLNHPAFFLQLLEARRQMILRNWKNARQTLDELLPLAESSAYWKIRVNKLLADCYEHLGDLQRRDDARRRAFDADSQSLQARIAEAQAMLARGEIDQAIDEYRKLVGQVPGLRGYLVSLLIAKNQRRLPHERDWSEVESLINIAKSQSPRSSEHVILRADLLLAQGKPAEAQRLVDEARNQDPQSGELWLTSELLLRRQQRLEEAEKLLDQAPRSVNPVDVQIQRIRLLIAKGGPNCSVALAALAANASSAPADDRRRLLEELAGAFTRLKDYAQARTLWLKVAKLDPTDLRPQVMLIDLAFQAENEADITRQIGKIKEMEAAGGPNGRYYQARYEIWKAAKCSDAAEQEQLCDSARRLIDELASHRKDFPQIFLLLAQIDELKAARPGASDDVRKESQYNAAEHYLRAFQLGQRELEIIRRVTDLLYSSGHLSEIVQLWNQLGTMASLVLQEQALSHLLQSRDFNLAQDLARQRVVADPKDFLKRLQLVQILLAQGRPEDAEIELRDAVRVVPGDFNRWRLLVQFLGQRRQFQKAEESIGDAEPALKSISPMGLAICCQDLGAAYQRVGNNPEKSKNWYGKAEEWFKIAQNAHPEDSGVHRRYIEFLVGAGKVKEAETALLAMLEKPRAAGTQALEEVSWARRVLAEVLIRASSDYQQVVRALALVEPIAQAAGALGKPGSPTVPAVDLRVLAEVYEAQRTSDYHKKAREVLEKLVAENLETPQDRFALAKLYRKDGDWPKARDQYRALLAQSEGSQDTTVANALPEYFAQFISELLRQHRTDHDQQDLAEAQTLLEKLEKLRPAPLILVELQARIHKALNQVDEARKLIASEANKSDATDQVLWKLAMLAETLEQTDLAEELLRKLVSRSTTIEYHLALIEYLGRVGKAKEGVDLCEGLWKNFRNPDVLAGSALKLFAAPAAKHDRTELNRVAVLFENALKTNAQSSNLNVALGNLRELQGLYQNAEEMYRRGIAQGGRNEIALNNLAWLMTLQKENLKEALDLINRAITLRGPIAELLDTRGSVYLASGDGQNAIKDFSEAVAQDPTGPKYFHLAQAHLQAGNKEAALRALTKAKDKGLTDEDLHPLEVAAYHQILTKLGMR